MCRTMIKQQPNSKQCPTVITSRLRCFIIFILYYASTYDQATPIWSPWGSYGVHGAHMGGMEGVYPHPYPQMLGLCYKYLAPISKLDGIYQSEGGNGLLDSPGAMVVRGVACGRQVVGWCWRCRMEVTLLCFLSNLV